MLTLAQFMETARAQLVPVCDNDKREAENIVYLLLEEILHIRRSRIKALEQRVLSEKEADTLSALLRRLCTGEPVQYALGVADFFGMQFKVNPHVLIPRPETEELVARVLKIMLPLAQRKSLRMIDIGTGSGCIAITVKKHAPNAEMLAVDKSESALETAMGNDGALKAGVDFLHCDFLDEREWQSLGIFDAIISNPPYITRLEYATLMKRVKDFEPEQALVAAGEEPFIFYQKIAGFGVKHLTASGYIFVEINSAYAQEIAAIFQGNGYRNVVAIKDLQGNERMLEVRK